MNPLSFLPFIGSRYPVEAETPIYIVGLALFFAILWWMFSQKTARVSARFPPLLVAAWLLIVGFFTGLFFISYLPNAQKLSEFGLTSVVLTPLSVSLPFVLLLAAMLLLSRKLPPIAKSIRTAVLFTGGIALVLATFYVGQMAYYDATHFIGPVHDLLLGSPPLATPSWYGFLPLTALAFVFHFLPLTIGNLYVTIATVETLGYLLLFFFARWLFKSDRWALVTMLGAIIFHFLVQVVDRNFYLQSTFIRFGIWLPVATAIFAQRRTLLWIALGAALLWTTDMGIYVVGAYLATLVLLRRPVLPVLSVLAISLAAVNAFVFLRYGQLPQWQNFWAFSLSYTSIPMFQMPIPQSIFPWMYLLIPVTTLTVLLYKRRRGTWAVEHTVMTYLSWLALFMFIYFTAHNHLNSLRSINLPALLCLVWLTREYVLWLTPQGKSVVLIGSVAFALAAAPLLSVWGAQALRNINGGNIVTTLSAIRHPAVSAYDIVGPTARSVQQKYGAVLLSRDFAIVSPWDTYYLLIWNTTNPLGSNCLLCYWTPQMAKDLIRNMETLRVTYVFVDANRVGYEGRVSWIFTDSVGAHYRFIERIGDLDVYKRR